MAKRFTATEIWEEDWFLEMPIEYKLFWYYMLANCDHAGLFKVNLRSFCSLNEVKLTSTAALEFFNNGKDRIREVSSSLWLIEDFFVFQYGPTFNPKNRVHESIFNLYEKNNVELTSIRGLLDLKDRVKDKDKDKDKDNKINIASKKEIAIPESNFLWFLKFYHSTYEYYLSVFNGQSTTEASFLQWKEFIDFIYQNNFEEVFHCKFINPQDFAKVVKEEKFTKDKWEETLKKILATGIKPEHNLLFRIPEFMKYGKQKLHGSKADKSGLNKPTLLTGEDEGRNYGTL